AEVPPLRRIRRLGGFLRAAQFVLHRTSTRDVVKRNDDRAAPREIDQPRRHFRPNGAAVAREETQLQTRHDAVGAQAFKQALAVGGIFIKADRALTRKALPGTIAKQVDGAPVVE